MPHVCPRPASAIYARTRMARNLNRHTPRHRSHPEAAHTS